MNANVNHKSAILVRAVGGERVVLASDLSIADDVVSRNVGLLKHRDFPKGQGLWIKRCNSIHTFFMRFPIDAVFVDKKLKVVAVYRDLKPWRVTRLHFKASSVFELPAGTLDATVETAAGTEGKAIAAGDILIVEGAKVNGGSNG